VFVDGIYLGVQSGIVLDNFDLEGIEVLRGPQGLLFGRNVTGGAVLLRTSTPGQDLRITAKAAVETGTNVILSGAVSGPLIDDKLAGKIAVYYNHDQGWFRNRFDGSSLGRSEQLVLRTAFKLTPADGVELILRGEHGDQDGDGAVGQNHALFPRGTFGVSINTPGYTRIKWSQFFAEGSVEAGPGTLTNVAGYRRFRSDLLNDVDSTPQSLAQIQIYLKQHQFSNELRYAARLGKIDLVAGLYYFNQSLFSIEARELLGGAIKAAGGGRQKQSSVGAFISADWEFADGLTLNLGGRQSWEKKRVTIQQTIAGGCNIVARTCGQTFADKESWQGFTPKIGLQWRARSDVNLYGFYTRGFRSGGYNLRNTDPAVPPGPFDQEVQDSFEIGAKIGNSRSYVNIAAFHNDIAGLQREINVPGPLGTTQIIQNTADATVKGFEIDGQLRVAGGLSLTGFVGYVDGQYKNILYDISGDGLVNDIDKALKLPRLSPWSYGAGIRFDHDSAKLGRIAANVSIAHRDLAYITDNNVGFLQAGDILDAALSWTPAGSRFSFSLYGKNLLNEALHSSDSPLAALFGGPGASFSALQKGRVIGAEIAFLY
jgi:iron complex outermembrane receptor protein